MTKKKKELLFQILFLIIGIFVVSMAVFKIAEMLSVEALQDAFPKDVLQAEGNQVVYGKKILNTENLNFEDFSPCLLYSTGQGIGEYRDDVYVSCNSDSVKDITFFCGEDMGDVKNNISFYSDMFYLAFGKTTISFSPVISEEGYFDGYSTMYDGGRLRINHDSQHDLYVLSYRMYLSHSMGNKWFVCFTSKKDSIADAKKLLDYMVRQILDESKIVEEEKQSSIPGIVTTVSQNSIGNTRVTEQVVLENGDKMWQQADMTVIETVNFDYALLLKVPYKMLHVSYEYIDITQTPDSIILISPQNKIYQPTEIQQKEGTVTFLIENAQEGEWKLSVRNETSLGGAQVLFMEEEKWKELHGYDTGRFD